MKRNRAFTLIELLVVIAIIALLIGILLPAIGKAKRTAAALKDSTQVRSLHQGLVVFASSNNDLYPLPSRLDKNDKTIQLANTDPANAIEKDTTGNIFAVLIQAGLIDTEICLSPIDQGNFEQYKDYEADRPQGAVGGSSDDSEQALWDPNFRGTPLDPEYSNGTATSAGDQNGPGGFSYAHIPPVQLRRAQWQNTFSSVEPVLSTRGASFTLDGNAEDGTWQLLTTDEETGSGDNKSPVGISSVTLAMFGSRSEWAGNVGFNDNHVTVYNQPDPEPVIWQFTGLQNEARAQADNIFVNEDDQDRTPVAATPSGATLTLSGEENNRNALLWQYYEVTISGNNTTISPYYD
ncbi:MAG: type II secretion system protein [Phycisphaerales bacterium]